MISDTEKFTIIIKYKETFLKYYKLIEILYFFRFNANKLVYIAFYNVPLINVKINFDLH